MNFILKMKKIMSSRYFYSLLNKGFHILFGFIITVIVNRFLGAELRGEYAFIFNVISIIVIIGNLGIYQSYPFYKRKNIENIELLYINIIVKQLLLYLVLALCGLTIYYKFFNVSTDDFILLLISTLLSIITISSHQISMIASVVFFKTKSIIIIISEFFKLIFLVFIYITLDRNLIPILVANVLYHLIIFILCIYKLKVPINFWKHNTKFTIILIKKGLIPMLFTLLLSLNYSIDIFYLKLSGLVSVNDVGLYAVGVQLASYVWVIPDIFKEVLYSKTAKNDSITDIVFCLKISLLIEIFFLLIVAIFGKNIFEILYGIEYIEAANVTKIIFIGILSMSLFKILTPLYNAKGKFIENFIILLSSVLINLVFNSLLVPSYGILGAAIASVIGYSICGLIYLLRFKKEYGFKLKNILFITKDDIRIIKSIFD